MNQEKKYYHLLTKEEAEYAKSLPEHIFRRTYQSPGCCRFTSAMDKTFGCPWILKDEIHRTQIVKQCKDCPCSKSIIQI